jgi:hypothetical protein
LSSETTWDLSGGWIIRRSGAGKQLLGCLTLPLLLFLLPAAYGQRTAKPETAKDNQAPLYEIIELPLRPLSISNSEWIAGTTPDQHAAVWNPKTGVSRVSLPPEFSFSECTSINSRGEAVGTAATADSSRRVAFVVRHDEVVLLPGEQSRANDINEDGEIVGQAILPGGKSARPVLWKNGSLIDLPICCSGSARHINGQSLIVGDTYDKEGRYHAFLWDAVHGTHLLSVPGEDYSSALALDSRGKILLKATPGGLFLYSHGELHSLEIPKGTPRAMNQDGIVVGSFGPNPDAQRAFVWDKAHGMQDLNALILSKSEWKLEVASAINERGEIVGWGDHGGVENAGFLLRPLANERKSYLSRK